MELKLTNTLSRRKEVFAPPPPARVGIYTCGPTVYADAHIGNLRSYIFPDILKKTLRRLGYEVRHVMNITDVGHLTSNEDTGEDKMERAARSAGRSAWEIAAEHTERFLRDLERLNIEPPDVLPRAAGPIPPELLERVRAISPRYATAPGHIDDQIELVRKLEAKGVTYRTEDGIYFDTSRFPAYGKLARIRVEGLQEGARVEMGGKRNKTDFALWKFSPPDTKRQMEWPSPWGRGFPGWHLECSAMSMKYLGESFDIHTGGSDHIPVHHTNEIAQSECATGHPFVRYWLHGEFLVLGEDKRMGKSEGNLITVQDLIGKGFSPMAYRYLVLNTHYRKFLNFSAEAMEGARTALDGLRKLVSESMGAMDVADMQGKVRNTDTLDMALDDAKELLLEALCDDLNTPKALGILWTELRGERLDGEDKVALASLANDILSLDLFGTPSAHTIVSVPASMPDEIASLAEQRWSARQRLDFKESDRLRDELLSRGWKVRDRKDGYDVVRSGS
jgi:cysteinyl-tRNA synthetase